MNVKLLRLTTGEDLIADVTSQKDFFTFENPCLVYVQQGQPGKGAQIGMTRWMPYAENKEFTMDSKFVVTMAEPVEELRQQYDSVFGSGLIIPKQGLTLVDK